MEWTYELYYELSDLVYSIEALENGYYDTHDLDYIAETREDIENRIGYLTERLPLKNTDIYDYKWCFQKNKLVYLN